MHARKGFARRYPALRLTPQRTSPRAQGLRLREVLPMQASTSWDDVAFSSTERDRHLGSRPVSQIHTWPVVAPVNASRRPSRDAAHHLGSGWLARPSPWGTLTSYSLPANWRTLLQGQTRKSSGRAKRDRIAPSSGHKCRRCRKSACQQETWKETTDGRRPSGRSSLFRRACPNWDDIIETWRTT